MKKKLALILSCALTACAMTASMGTQVYAGEKEEPVTLTLYGDVGNVQRPFMQKLFELYEEKTGNKLDVQGIESENFETVCLTKFQTGDIPDLFLHHGGYSLDAYNPAENFVDFSDAEWVSDIQDSVLPTAMRDGKVYGLPFWEASYSGLLYNTKIFEECGIELPKTQDEFNAVCDKLLENDIQPIYLPLKDAWPILYQYGMDPIFEDCWDTWLYSDYDSEAYTYVADDFGLMPAFVGTTENGTFEGPNCCLTLANKNSENADAAIEFINFMADPENYNVAFEGSQTAPVFKQQTTIDMTPQYKAAEEWIAEAGHASIANPEIIGFSNVDGAKCIQEMLLGNVDVDTCLARMDEERIKAAKTQNAEGF